MARIRYIKPEFFEDTDTADLSRDARLLYIGLWCFMDRQGVMEDNAKQIKRNVFPYDDDLSVGHVGVMLDQLVKAGRLVRLAHEGKPYLYCPSFKRHQKVHPGEKTKCCIPTHLLAIPEASNSEIPAEEKGAGIGIGIGIGTGTGIGIGTGIGTGTGTADDDEVIKAGQARLEALRATRAPGFNWGKP